MEPSDVKHRYIQATEVVLTVLCDLVVFMLSGIILAVQTSTVRCMGGFGCSKDRNCDVSNCFEYRATPFER